MKLSGNFKIHVNRQFIAKAAKEGRTDVPTLIVRKAGKSYYCRAVNFLKIKSGNLAGPGVVPQLNCGARTYFTMSGDIELIDPSTFAEAKELFKNGCSNTTKAAT